MANFGAAAAGPGLWKNPLAHKLGAASIYASAVGVTQEATYQTGTSFTTTTTTWQQLLSTDIFIPKAHVCLFMFANLLVEHTVAGATFDVDIELTTGRGLDYVIDGRNGVTIPLANARVPVSLSAGSDVDANLPDVLRPDRRTMSLWIKNNTAGTLTVRAGVSGGSTYDEYILHAFLTGDSSR